MAKKAAPPKPAPKAAKAARPARPKPAKAPKPREPGREMIPLPVRYWVRWYRCGCHHEAAERRDLKPWCAQHLLNPKGDDIAVHAGEAFPTRPEMGRPSLYNPQTSELVCTFIACGWKLRDFNDPERRLAAEDFQPEECERIAAALPTKATITRWMGTQPDFRARYAQAQRAYLEGVGSQEALDIADDGSQDYIFTSKGLAFDAEHVQRSRLRVGYRQWLLERLASGTYSERKVIDAKVTAGPPDARRELYNASEEELVRIIQERRQLGPPGVHSGTPESDTGAPQ